MGRGRNGNASGSNRPANASGNSAATQRAKTAIENVMRRYNLTPLDFSDAEIKDMVDFAKRIQKAGEADNTALNSIDSTMSARKEAKPNPKTFNVNELLANEMNRSTISQIQNYIGEVETRIANIQNGVDKRPLTGQRDIARMQRNITFANALITYKQRFKLK